MSNIVKFDKVNLAPSLAPNERQIVLAFSDQKVSEVTLVTIGDIVTDCIDKGLVDLGYKNTYLEPKERDVLIQTITYDIRKYFKSLTVTDIKNVFSLGVRGEFKARKEDLCLITAVNVFNWLKLYSEIKKEAIKKQNVFLLNNPIESIEPTTEELKQYEKNTVQDIIDDYRRFLANGTVPSDFGNVQYDYLKRIGKINFSKEEQSEIWKLAKQEVVSQLIIKKKNSKGYEVKECNKIIEAILNNSDDTKGRILIVAKRIGLHRYFQQLKEMEIDISDFLTEDET